MSKKLLTIGAAMVLVLAVAFVAASDSGNAVACKDKAGAKASTASASSSCSAAAKTASAGTCTRSATASSGCCASGKAAVAGYTKGECGDNAAALNEITDEVPYGERKRVVVAGTMECGHCTFNKTAGCAPLIKTSDGKVYPLLNDDMVKRMRKTKTEEGFELSARVRKLEDGVKYLEVVSFKAL